MPDRRRRRRRASQRRVEHRYLDEWTDDLDDAVERVLDGQGRAPGAGRSASSATPPRCCPSCCAAASPSTSSPTRPRAHDPLSYLPARRHASRTGTSTPRANPEGFTDRARESMAKHVEAMVGFMDAGAEVFDYGNSIRGEAELGRLRRAPSSSPASCRPTSGRCSARARARSAGRRSPATPPTSPPPTRAVLELFPDNEPLHRWITRRPGAHRVPGAAGPDLLARLRRARQGRPARSTRWCAAGERQGADRHRPRPPRHAARWPRPTARPRRCSTAPTPSPTGRCSTRWSTPPPARRGSSIHHGGGVGIGRSHPRRPGLASPTAPPLAAEKLERVLTNDPAWASSATSTPATTSPIASPRSAACASRCARADRPNPTSCDLPTVLAARDGEPCESHESVRLAVRRGR